MAGPPNPKGIRARLAKAFLRLPFVGRLYLKAMVRALEKTPRSKLPPHLQPLHAMLQQVPKQQRLAMLEAAMRGKLPKPEQYGRTVRRAAQRQAKPKRRR